MPGYPGQQVPTVLEAGETVLPTQNTGISDFFGKTEIHIHLDGDINDRTARWFVENQDGVAQMVHDRFIENRLSVDPV